MNKKPGRPKRRDSTHTTIRIWDSNKEWLDARPEDISYLVNTAIQIFRDVTDALESEMAGKRDELYRSYLKGQLSGEKFKPIEDEPGESINPVKRPRRENIKRRGDA